MSTQLSRLQRALQHSIVGGGFDASSGYTSSTDDVVQRLGIYATAYRLRLQDALAHNFPMLQQLLGLERFSELAMAYLDANPSTHASVRAFGIHLSAWLQTRHPGEPWIAEFARLEWALADAFDAPDQDAIEISSLAELDPERWPQLRFEFGAAVQQLTLSSNAAELYAQISADDVPSTGHKTDRPSEWLIWREAFTARYRSIGDIEATALQAVRGGNTFAQMCEELFERYEDGSVPMHAAALLKRWMTDGLIVRFSSTEN